MHVIAFTDLDELSPYADQWDRLAAGVPFRSWAWMSAWWRHYGLHDGEGLGVRLLVLGVFDSSDRLAGIAPWYLKWTSTQGRVLRWLGSGEVCSDYLSVLCRPGGEDDVAATLADYLTGQTDSRQTEEFTWDLLEIQGVDGQDRPTKRLIECLVERGCLVHRCVGANCWRIELPDTWEAYLATLSKGHRKQIHRGQRNLFETGRAMLHTVQTQTELLQALDLLIRLHQQRRQSLGQRGCFVSPRYDAFHREVMPRMLANGQLQLHWLEIDGRPVAAEYHLSGEGITYAYQAGIDPAALACEPGRLITVATLRRAIEQGGRAMDFLRGNESYKAHFRAQPRGCLALRIVPNRATSRLRHGIWLTGKKLKAWIK